MTWASRAGSGTGAAGGRLALPATTADVTPEWLSAALSQRFPGTEVREVAFGSAVRATGTKLRMMLSYNDAGHAHRLPATMWFKGGYEPHSPHVRTSHARESLFYGEIEPLGLLNAPCCYFAGVDEATGFGAQLIEDLLQRNARFGDARRPIPVEAARHALAQLARMHAHWWNAADLARLGAVGGSLATDGIVIRIMSGGAWERAMDFAVAADLPAPLRTFAGAAAGMERLWTYDRESRRLCMVHGDPHPGNLFFEQDGTPGFLDWQRLMQCDWAHDVAYFIIGCLDIDACVAHERDLLAGYLQELAARGVAAPGWDEAWLDYRRHAMYGLVWNVVPPVMQPAEVCAVAARRFNAAARRLAVHEALFA